ncbi:MAG: hypothetical protein Q8876_01080 [Bacillota bacterium]|nr:hypothetical protein [Bacillota bacterium]
MTKKELSQLYFLNREIEREKYRLAELEVTATSLNYKITGIPNGKGVSDKVGKCATEIADLHATIELNIKRCFYELNRLNIYIQSIDDSEIRQILTLRYINGLEWEQVAANISIYATEDSVRMKHNRFLNKK